MRSPHSRTERDLLVAAKDLVFALDSRQIAAFRDAWPAGRPPRELPRPTAVPLPVLRWLPSAPAAPQAFGAGLVSTLYAAGPRLRWRQTYTARQTGANFLHRYGYTVLIGPDGLIESDALACGLLLLGPATTYPRHRHEAEEIYVTLSGNADWLQGDGIWRSRRPGQIVHHASGEPHAMRTRDHALLALYLWRSANLNQKAELE